MHVISNYILQFSDIQFGQMQASPYDLIITDPGFAKRDDLGYTPAPPFTDAQLAALIGQSRVIAAYLNVSVTDHLGSYWDDSWAAFTDAENRDNGPLNGNAPAWLANNHGTAGGPDPVNGGSLTYGYIVDYANTDWQDRVIAEAVSLVTPTAQGGAGFNGLFLDDVGRYYAAAANDPTYSYAQAADDMIVFVNRLSDAVRAVQPDAYIAINGGAYIVGDSSAPSGIAGQNFHTNVDALLLETQYDPTTGASTAWADAQANFGNDTDFLALERADELSDIAGLMAFGEAAGVLIQVSENAEYNTLPVTPSAGSNSADTLTGGDGPNHLSGLGGGDTIFGGDGNDIIYGGPGDDFIFAGAGNDTVYGGGGNDTIIGGDGHDIIYGGNGNDAIFGGAGNDDLRGISGNDTVIGGGGHDTIYGGDGADILIGGNHASFIEPDFPLI